MRLVPSLVVAAVATACASSGSTSSRPATETIRIDGVGSLDVATHPTSAAVGSVAASIDRAWAALPAVYDSLAIPVTRADAATHVIANDGLKIRTRLGKTSLSRYLDCGNTQMGPSADNYEVYLMIATQLKPSGTSETVVETTLEATAKPIQFSQAPSRCTSKGVLEPRVNALLTTLVATDRR